MRKHHVPLIIFLIVILCICGCIQTASESKPEAITNPPSTSLTTIPTVSFTPTSTPFALKDPFVGTWICYSYPASGRLKKAYTFMENNTWTRTNTNLNSRVQAYSHGVWRKESDNNYWVKSLVSGGSTTFQYNKTTDELYEPGFQETFHRTSEANSPTIRLPTMNISLHAAQKVSKLQGSHHSSGNIYLIVKVSIKNSNETGGYSFDEKSIWVLYDDGPGEYSNNQNMVGRLLNLIPFGTIAQGETRQGNVIFGVPENSHSYTLKLVDSEGDTVSNIIKFENILTSETYAPDPDINK
jgi:hypothetical protein